MGSHSKLTFTTLSTNSADNKLTIFFWENRIYLQWRQFAWHVKAYFLEKLRIIIFCTNVKYFCIYPKYSDTWNPYHTCSKISTSTIYYPLLYQEIARWVKNSADPDEIPHSAASHLGLHFLLRPVHSAYTHQAYLLHKFIDIFSYFRTKNVFYDIVAEILLRKVLDDDSRIISSVLHKNISCGYSLEAPCWGVHVLIRSTL